MEIVGVLYFLMFEIAFSVAIWYGLKNEKVKNWWLRLKKKMLLMLLASLPSLALAQTNANMSLQQCIDYALSNHYTIKKANIEQDIFAQQRREALSNGLPQVSMNGNFTNNLKIPVSLLPAEIVGGEKGQFVPVQFGTKYNMTGGLEVNQLLYSHRFWKALEYAGASKQVAVLNKEKAKEDVIFNVTIAYYQVQITQEQQEIVKNNLAQTQKLVEITELQVKNGVAKPIDLDRIKVSKTNLETDLSNLNLAYTQQINVLKFAMGKNMKEEIGIALLDKNNMLSVSSQTTARLNSGGEANQNHIDFRLLSQQKHLKNLEIKAIKAEAMPSLSFFMTNNYQSFGERFNFLSSEAQWFRNTAVGLTLQIPVFDGFRRNSKVQKAKLELQQLEMDMNYLGQNIQMQISNSESKFAHYQRYISNQESNKALAEKVYQVTQEQYKNGVAGLTDLLNAENALKTAQSNYLNALVELKIAEVELKKAMGVLTQNLE